ncbi:MAG: [CysO sulfur-carrier protein]-thiocarboxylate-dependent cysteine synthase, partial [Gaiellales bacterium]|nr:[CysO sulfur-carrier protein]-thiocarboxylate-dependent cysteine synthase [Gaiellales bacterium]
MEARPALAPPRAVQFCRTVGGTPLVELTRLAPSEHVRLFAKLEWFNPTGSVKDRVACAMLDAAAEAGELWPGRRILEPSSGNTGIALAMQGRLRGLDVSIVMPAGSTPERGQLMRLFAKLEWFNPTGSVKDRVACAMLDAATEAGELWPGRRILEPSSGNTGIALAMQGRLRGLDVSIVMPAGSTPEREQLMRLFGADVIYSPAELGSNGAVTMARELSEADPTLYMPFQYGNAANPRAHERGTAEEILAACPEVDVFVAGLGTGGTLMGCARRLRR